MVESRKKIRPLHYAIMAGMLLFVIALTLILVFTLKKSSKESTKSTTDQNDTEQAAAEQTVEPALIEQPIAQDAPENQEETVLTDQSKYRELYPQFCLPASIIKPAISEAAVSSTLQLLLSCTQFVRLISTTKFDKEKEPFCSILQWAIHSYRNGVTKKPSKIAASLSSYMKRKGKKYSVGITNCADVYKATVDLIASEIGREKIDFLTFDYKIQKVCEKANHVVLNEPRHKFVLSYWPENTIYHSIGPVVPVGDTQIERVLEDLLLPKKESHGKCGECKSDKCVNIVDYFDFKFAQTFVVENSASLITSKDNTSTSVDEFVSFKGKLYRLRAFTVCKANNLQGDREWTYTSYFLRNDGWYFGSDNKVTKIDTLPTDLPGVDISLYEKLILKDEEN